MCKVKEQIRKLILDLGADICGFSNIDRFDKAPAGFHPKDIFPTCRSVIVFGAALPRGLAMIEPRLIYAHYNNLSVPEIDRIAFVAAKQIEKISNMSIVPLPSDDPYEYWNAAETEGRGLLSMKHAAVFAGLGTLEKSTLLLNKAYGTMLTLGAILTELDLPSDPPAQSICIEDCDLCIRSCPSHALSEGHVEQSKCRVNTYGKNLRGFDVVNCNKCRTVCPMRFGKSANVQHGENTDV